MTSSWTWTPTQREQELIDSAMLPRVAPVHPIGRKLNADIGAALFRMSDVQQDQLSDEELSALSASELEQYSSALTNFQTLPTYGSVMVPGFLNGVLSRPFGDVLSQFDEKRDAVHAQEAAYVSKQQSDLVHRVANALTFRGNTPNLVGALAGFGDTPFKKGLFGPLAERRIQAMNQKLSTLLQPYSAARDSVDSGWLDRVEAVVDVLAEHPTYIGEQREAILGLVDAAKEQHGAKVKKVLLRQIGNDVDSFSYDEIGQMLSDLPFGTVAAQKRYESIVERIDAMTSAPETVMEAKSQRMFAQIEGVLADAYVQLYGPQDAAKMHTGRIREKMGEYRALQSRREGLLEQMDAAPRSHQKRAYRIEARQVQHLIERKGEQINDLLAVRHQYTLDEHDLAKIDGRISGLQTEYDQLSASRSKIVEHKKTIVMPTDVELSAGEQKVHLGKIKARRARLDKKASEMYTRMGELRTTITQLEKSKMQYRGPAFELSSTDAIAVAEINEALDTNPQVMSLLQRLDSLSVPSTRAYDVQGGNFGELLDEALNNYAAVGSVDQWIAQTTEVVQTLDSALDAALNGAITYRDNPLAGVSKAAKGKRVRTPKSAEDYDVSLKVDGTHVRVEHKLKPLHPIHVEADSTRVAMGAEFDRAEAHDEKLGLLYSQAKEKVRAKLVDVLVQETKMMDKGRKRFVADALFNPVAQSLGMAVSVSQGSPIARERYSALASSIVSQQVEQILRENKDVVETYGTQIWKTIGSMKGVRALGANVSHLYGLLEKPEENGLAHRKDNAYLIATGILSSDVELTPQRARETMAQLESLEAKYGDDLVLLLSQTDFEAMEEMRVSDSKDITALYERMSQAHVSAVSADNLAITTDVADSSVNDKYLGGLLEHSPFGLRVLVSEEYFPAMGKGITHDDRERMTLRVETNTPKKRGEEIVLEPGVRNVPVLELRLEKDYVSPRSVSGSEKSTHRYRTDGVERTELLADKLRARKGAHLTTGVCKYVADRISTVHEMSPEEFSDTFDETMERVRRQLPAKKAERHTLYDGNEPRAPQSLVGYFNSHYDEVEGDFEAIIREVAPTSEFAERALYHRADIDPLDVHRRPTSELSENLYNVRADEAYVMDFCELVADSLDEKMAPQEFGQAVQGAFDALRGKAVRYNNVKIPQSLRKLNASQIDYLDSQLPTVIAEAAGTLPGEYSDIAQSQL